MTADLPPLPPPAIYVTHENEEVYCGDCPREMVPPHDDYYSCHQMREYGKLCATAAVLAERERCAAICETLPPDIDSGEQYADEDDAYCAAQRDCAAAIRAERTTTKEPQ